MHYARVQRLDLPPGRRVLVVSDIHGNLPFLKGLLRRAGFSREDILIVLGDLVEKGEQSLETLRYLMKLSQQHEVYTICGNCDDIAINFTDRDGDLDLGFFNWYLKRWGERCLLLQMGREAGFVLRGPEDYPALRVLLKREFAPELDFLRDLPTILETQRFRFVHGGIPREDRLEELEAWRCMKNDYFLNQGHEFKKWCVVGHCPVTLYHAKIPDASPIVARERRIVSIDGGCCLKLDGQLNALVLPQDGSEEFAHFSYDGLSSATALDTQAPSEDSINIRWGEDEVEVLERGIEFCRCRHIKSGRLVDILTDYLTERDGKTHCEDSTDYRLPVSPGDVLSIVRRTGRGYLAKKTGVTGWYLGRIAENKAELA